MAPAAVDTQNKALSVTISPHLTVLFDSNPKSVAIPAAVVWLSAFFERPTPEMVQAAYLDRLFPLSCDQLVRAFSRAGSECKFWPSPAVLLELAGVETSDQSSERQAREDLQSVLWRIRRHGVDGHPARGAVLRKEGRDEQGVWGPAVYEEIPAPSVPDRVLNALYEFGGSDLQTGVKLVAEHPLLGRDADEYPSLGLKLVAIEKLEARWIAAWRKVNR